VRPVQVQEKSQVAIPKWVSLMAIASDYHNKSSVRVFNKVSIPGRFAGTTDPVVLRFQLAMAASAFASIAWSFAIYGDFLGLVELVDTVVGVAIIKASGTLDSGHVGSNIGLCVPSHACCCSSSMIFDMAVGSLVVRKQKREKVKKEERRSSGV
jgi:hypothetical protein